MNCIIYGVTWRGLPPPLPALDGIESQPLLSVEHQALCAVISAHAQCPAADAGNLQAYEAVINALCACCDFVPMRFGTCLPDQDALRTWLDKEQESYAALLQRIAACVEIGLRYRSLPAAASPIEAARGEGHAYLAARSHRHAALQEPALDPHGGRIAAALADLSRGYGFDPVSDGLAGLHFLVPRANVEAFLARSRQLAAQDDRLLYLTGPWPPYSFANPDNINAQHRRGAWH